MATVKQERKLAHWTDSLGQMGPQLWPRADLISVFTLAVWMSYILNTASLTFCLVARTSTMKTRVLLSSIFFMADSVVSGYFNTPNWSSLLVAGTDLRGYFGARFSCSVFGRWNVTFVMT